MKFGQPSEDTLRELLRRFIADRFADHGDEFQREALKYFDANPTQSRTCEGYRTGFIEFQGRWWTEYIYSPEIRPWFDRKLREAFGAREVLVEEADEFVSGRLSRNRFHRLRKYRGMVCRKKFVRTVLGNLLRDYQRKMYGRPRPPKAVSSLGDLHERLFRLLCVEQRHNEEAIVIILAADPTGTLNDSKVREAIRELRGIVPDCGSASVGRALDSANSGVDTLFTDEGPADMTDMAERFFVILVKLLLEYIERNKRKRTSTDEFARNVRVALVKLQLTDLEILLLRKFYVEEKYLAKIALELRIPENEINLHWQSLQKRIREVLREFGLDFDDPEGAVV